MKPHHRLILRRLLAVLAGFGAALLLLLLLRVPILQAVGNLLVVWDPVTRTEALVVLSGQAFQRGSAGADAYQRGVAPEVWITIPLAAPEEAHGYTTPQVAVLKRVLIDQGVPNEAIRVLPETVLTTEHEAEAVCRTARQRGLHSLAVLTSSYHTRRARIVFRRRCPRLGVSVAIISSPESLTRWWSRPHLRTDVAIELVRLPTLLFDR